MKPNLKISKKFLRYAILGVVNTLVHLGIVSLFVELNLSGVVIANAVAFFVANANSYVLNSFITFKEKLSFHKYVSFFFTSVFALVVVLFVVTILDSLEFHYLMSTVVSIFIAPLFTFLLYKKFVFKS